MRTPRKWSDQDIYHVVSRGTGRQLIFEDDDDRRVFLDKLHVVLTANHVELYAWCLMSNHVHLLMHAPIENISLCMKRLCGEYALYFNHKSGRVGHLFQERFKSEPVDTEPYLLQVVRYIHENPLRAGISPTREYQWSSYSEYLESPGVSHPAICETQFVLGVFGGIGAFVEFHDEEHDVASCLDVSSGRSLTRAMPDDIARTIADEVLGKGHLDEVKELPVEERREALRLLKRNGLTVRQIERLTGIGRNTVQRA